MDFWPHMVMINSPPKHNNEASGTILYNNISHLATLYSSGVGGGWMQSQCYKHIRQCMRQVHENNIYF